MINSVSHYAAYNEAVQAGSGQQSTGSVGLGSPKCCLTNGLIYPVLHGHPGRGPRPPGRWAAVWQPLHRDPLAAQAQPLRRKPLAARPQPPPRRAPCRPSPAQRPWHLRGCSCSTPGPRCPSPSRSFGTFLRQKAPTRGNPRKCCWGGRSVPTQHSPVHGSGQHNRARAISPLSLPLYKLLTR